MDVNMGSELLDWFASQPDRKNDVPIGSAVWLVPADWEPGELWIWQCRVCDDSHGPLASRECAEAGARLHRHRDTQGGANG